uniref:Uncharacterized protein n=1 Tax=Anguilla anguilla TaxID=7936 RepID=A0A0E9XW74_ANGAN
MYLPFAILNTFSELFVYSPRMQIVVPNEHH